jgi:hypothetical protein
VDNICEAIGPFSDGELDETEAQKVREHLPGCESCQKTLLQNMQLQALFDSVARSPPRKSCHVIAPISFRNMEPMERRKVHCRSLPDAPPVLYSRLVIRMIAEEPNIRLYTMLHKVGGSRRKGRIVSNHWAIDRLRHLSGRWEPNVILTDITIGKTSQMVHGGGRNGVPAQIFDNRQQGLDLRFDLCKSGMDISLEMTNHDTRIVNIEAVMMGQTVW